MIYTILVEDNLFGVNREFRRVNLGRIPKNIVSVQYDTVRQTGVIEFTRDDMVTAQVRDLDLEREEYEAARKNNKKLEDLKPRYKTIPVPRGRRVISDFEQFEYLIPLWQQAPSRERKESTERGESR